MVRDGFGDCGLRPYVRTVVVPAHIATQTGEGLLRADALVRQMAGVLP